MEKKRTFLLFLLCLLLLSGVMAEGIDRDNQIFLLQSDSTGLVFEVRVPFFETQERIHTQGIFQTLEVPGLGQISEVGRPLLPLKGTLIEIPSTGNIKIKILETNTEDYVNYRILPCPKYVKKEDDSKIYLEEKFALDHNFYSNSRFYPPSISELGFSGFIRERKVAQVKIYPFQYNPATGILRHHKRIMVQVLFEQPSVRNTGELSDPHFDKMFKDIILNFRERPFVNLANTLGSHQQSFEAQQRPSDCKILVDKTGIYKIAFWDLVDAGISPHLIDARTFKMFCQGKEIAIYISSNESTLRPSDYILFYGQAIHTDYTDTSVYWLSWGGSYGKRMAEVKGAPKFSSQLKYHYRKDHFELNNEYWITMPKGKGKDHWFWERIHAGETKNYTFNLNRPASDSLKAKVKVMVFGRTSIFQKPDHHLKIYVNGNYRGEGHFDGQRKYECTVNVDQSLLKHGSNTLQVELVNDTGSPNSIYMNYFDVEYYDKFFASDSSLSFDIDVSGNKKIQVSNFSESSIEIFDISNHNNVRRIVNFAVKKAGSYQGSPVAKKSFKAIFGGKFSGKEKYLALTKKSIIRGRKYLKKLSSSTIPMSQKTDYIIISHEDFYKKASSLADYRTSKGLKVQVVKVGDIYDQFNHGIVSPQAIRAFLRFAYEEWERPSYVLFLGDANVDAHDYMGTTRKNFVPTYLYDLSDIQILNDNWFVCISENDMLPDYFSGRIPVKSAIEAKKVIDKIMNHEKLLESRLMKKSIFVADDNDNTFPDLNDELAKKHFPSDFKKTKIYLGNYTYTDSATADLIEGINEGALAVTYVGHGSYDNWANENIFLASDVDSLANSRFPFVVCLPCLNGYFANWPRDLWSRHIDDCLAEKFVKAPNRGAIAVYAPTGLGYTWEHRLLGINLYDMLFKSGEVILGKITTQAKIDAYAQGSTLEQVQTFMLFGDPACSLTRTRK